MNYDEIKAQYMQSPPAANAARTGRSNQPSAGKRNSLGSIFGMTPFVIGFLAAAIGGLWFLQVNEASQKMMQRWTGHYIPGVEGSQFADETATDDSGSKNSNAGKKTGSFDAAANKPGF